MANEDRTDPPTPEDRDRSLKVDREDSGIVRDEARESKARDMALAAARLLDDDKCEEVLVLDLRGRSQVTEFFVIASGTSQRQMRSAGLHVEELGEERGFGLFKHNLGEKDASWFVLDFVDVVVHLFEPETRLFYDIEMLWGDAPRVAWGRDGEGSGGGPGDDRNRAGLRTDDVLPGP